MGKNLPANAGDTGDADLIPGSGRSSGGGHGNPLQYPCWENPMDRGATVHGVAKSGTRLSDYSFLFSSSINTCTLEKLYLGFFRCLIFSNLLQKKLALSWLWDSTPNTHTHRVHTSRSVSPPHGRACMHAPLSNNLLFDDLSCSASWGSVLTSILSGCWFLENIHVSS